MPGGGGITATNYLYHVAAKNGLVLGTFSNAMLTQPLFGADSVKFDARRLGWIGSTSQEDGVCIASHASGVKTWDEFRARRMIVCATAPGTTTHLFPTLLHRLFNVDLKLVTGYSDGSQIVLALQRGEVDAICQTWSSLKISHPGLLEKEIAKPVLFIGLGANRELASLPSMIGLARDDEQRGVLKIVLTPTIAGRPFATPPGVPADRLSALRGAFASLMHDAAFLEDARKTRVEVSPMDGAGIDALLGEIYASPPELIEQVKAIVAPSAR